jgi:LmbE family N-acetylglucosaminyl deacetylase
VHKWDRGTSDPTRTPDQLATLHETEQRAAAARLGATETTFLRYDDGDLAYNVQPLRHDLTKLIRQQRPEVIITHDPFAGLTRYEVCCLHPDHRATGEVAFEAAFFLRRGTPLLSRPDRRWSCLRESDAWFVKVSRQQLSRLPDRPMVQHVASSAIVLLSGAYPELGEQISGRSS